LLLLASPLRADDWSQFRGPGGTGISAETGLPTRWGPDRNVRWKAPLPGRGVSSPVVARGRVFVTACTGVRQDRLHVLCLDAATGKKRWERQFWATGNTLCHPKTCMAAPTPVTDGERVCALFGSGDLVCLDADGNLLWYRALARDYPQLTNQVGMAASPVLWRDVLLLAVETPGDSFAAGLDWYTGRNRWKVERPREVNWVTPLVVSDHSRAQAVFISSGEVTAYDPRTGRQCWSYTADGLSPTPSVPSAAAGERLVVTGGGVALRPGARGGEPAVAWKSDKLRPAYASPLYYRGQLFAVGNAATLLDCFDMKTGEVRWQHRVRGPFSASPVAGDGKVYLVNEDGVTTVLRPGPRPRVVATNAIGEGVLATPAISGGALFLRSDRHLYCVAEDRGE
jgi:outer membrane protein assembly factor BamB